MISKARLGFSFSAVSPDRESRPRYHDNVQFSCRPSGLSALRGVSFPSGKNIPVLVIGDTTMRQIVAILLACAALSGTAFVTADEKLSEATDRTQVTKFLKDYVLNKTVATLKTTYKLDENKMESDYEDQTMFNNFTETAQGFSFDMTIVSKDTRYDLDKDGKRVQPGRDLSGTEVYRYEIVERVSTKKLTGAASLLSMTTKAPRVAQGPQCS